MMINHNLLYSAMCNANAAPFSPSVIHQYTTGVLIRYRVDGDKPHSKNGWLSVFPDNAGAAFGNWKTGSKGYWFADNGTMPLTYAEQQQQERKCHEALQKAEKQRQAEQQHAAQCAADLWKQCTTANPEHPYLIKKQVQAFSIRQHQKALVLPVLDNNGSLISLQLIQPDGSKRFYTGARTKAGRFILGDINTGSAVLIAEGYATAATLHQATGLPVVICFNAGNLLAVVSDIRQAHRSRRIIICADNDVATPGNPGITNATQAADLFNADLMTPETVAGQSADFNDLALINGLAAVRAMFWGVA